MAVPVPPQTISIRRNRFIDGALEERIGLFNYNRFPVPIDVILTFSADFRDMFDVRGYHRPSGAACSSRPAMVSVLTPRARRIRSRSTTKAADASSGGTDLIFESGQVPTERTSWCQAASFGSRPARDVPAAMPVRPSWAPMPPAIRVR